MKLEWVLSSSVLILVVLVLRTALGKRISARLRYALWAVVLLRLLIPVPLYTSPVAGMSISAPQVPAALQEKSIYVLPVGSVPAGESDVQFAEDGTMEPFGDPSSFGYPRLENDGQTVVRYADKISPAELLLLFWTAGSAVLALVLLVMNFRFVRRLRRVRKPVDVEGCSLPVFRAAGLPSPCLFGLLRPAIYVTDAAAEDPKMLRHILAHELTHYRHLDHIWSIFRGIALAVHWWNPLVWLAVVLSRRDSELACDEGALRKLGDGERKAYGETLLSLVTAKAGPWDLLRCATTMTGEKRNLKERIARIASRQRIFAGASVIAVLVAVLFTVTAFGRKEQDAPQMSRLQVECTADLDWDGEEETIWVHQKLTPASEWTLDVIKGDYKTEDVASLWSVTLDESRSGCDTYFLYQEDGRDYLLEYMPRMEQGICDYSYRLFHLEDGGAVIDRKNRVTFDLTFSSQHHAMDPEAIADFMWEINSLIGESELLLNTNHWMLNLEDMADGRLRDNILVSLQYKEDRDYSTKEELIAALTDYAVYAADHPDDIYAPLGSDLSELEAADLGDISSQTAVTVEELAKLIREAALHRTSRFHEYGAFKEEESWVWTKAAWAIPLTDGGTLHLIACESGSVEMAYETEDGAASAYYTLQELYDLISEVGEASLSENLPYEADLDHDGEPDKLALKTGPDGMSWSLQCRTGDGLMWRAQAYTPHVGWNAVFLCRIDGEDYLLRYEPYMGGGVCEYSYRLFYLQEGREEVVQENAVDFDLIFSPDYVESHQFEPEAIAAFMEEINALLANSTQLLNTDENLLITFEKEGRLYDSVWWLDAEEDGFTVDEGKSLLENLTAFQENAERISQNAIR